MEQKKNNKVKRHEKEDLVSEIRKIPFKLELEKNSCPKNETENLMQILKQHKYYKSFFTNSCDENFMEYTKTQDVQKNVDRIENSPSNACYPGSNPREQKIKIFPETFSECLKKKPSKDQIQTPQKTPSPQFVVVQEEVKTDAKNDADDPFNQVVNVSKSYQTLEFPKPKSDYYSEKFYKIGNYFIDNLHNSLEKDTKKLVDQLANSKSKLENIQTPSVKQMKPVMFQKPQFMNPPPVIDPTMGYLQPILTVPPNFVTPSIHTIPLTQSGMEICLFQLQNSRELVMQQFHFQQQFYQSQCQQMSQLIQIQNNKITKKKKN